MAKLTALPELAIISGFRGVIDFYINYQACDREVSGPGIPCARSWPRKAIYKRSEAELATQIPLATASRLWSELSPEVRDSYERMIHGAGISGRDLFTKSYIGGIYRYPHEVTP